MIWTMHWMILKRPQNGRSVHRMEILDIFAGGWAGSSRSRWSSGLSSEGAAAASGRRRRQCPARHWQRSGLPAVVAGPDDSEGVRVGSARIAASSMCAERGPKCRVGRAYPDRRAGSAGLRWPGCPGCLSTRKRRAGRGHSLAPPGRPARVTGPVVRVGAILRGPPPGPGPSAIRDVSVTRPGPSPVSRGSEAPARWGPRGGVADSMAMPATPERRGRRQPPTSRRRPPRWRPAGL